MNNKVSIQDIADVFEKNNLCSKTIADTFLRTTFDMIAEFLEIDEFVKIKGLGTFKLVTVGKRESVNVNTGERIEIEGHSKVTFTPDVSIKDLINKPFSQFQTVVINNDTDIKELESVGKEKSSEEVSGLPDDVSETAQRLEQTESDEDDTCDNEQDATEDKAHDGVDVDCNSDLESSDSKVVDGIEEKASINDDKEEPLPTDSPDITVEDKKTAKDAESAEHGGLCNALEENAKADLENSEPTADKAEQEELPLEVTEIEQPQPFSEDSVTQVEEQTEDQENKEDSCVGEENIEKISDATVNNTEGIEVSKKGYILKAIVFSIFLIILLLLSYIAGYIRLINIDWALEGCNNSQIEEVKPAVITPVVAPKANKSIRKIDSESLEEKNKVMEQKPVAEPEIKTADKAKQNESIKTKNQLPSQSHKIVAEKEVKKTDESRFAQVQGGKYKIVGTTGNRIVDKGETLRQIAESEYGSKGYAQYIIVHNSIKNPDNVQAGTVLKLPKLESR